MWYYMFDNIISFFQINLINLWCNFFQGFVLIILPVFSWKWDDAKTSVISAFHLSPFLKINM